MGSIVRADANPTAAGSVTYTVTFDEAVTGVDSSDFELTAGGSVTGASVTTVTGSGSTYTVTVNAGTGDGTLRLDLKASGTGIADAASNAIATGYTAGEAYTISRLPLVNPSFENTPDLTGWTPFNGPSAGTSEVVRGSGEATDADAYARLVLDEEDGPEGRRSFGPGLRSDTFTLTAGQTVGLDFRPVETEDDAFVRVILFDANGNRVATLYDGTFDGEPGWQTVAAAAPADGDYYIEVQVGSFDDTFGGVIGAELHLENLRTGVTVPLTGDVIDVTPTVTAATVSTLALTFTRPVDPDTFSLADLFLGRGEESPNLLTGAETITWIDAYTVVIGGLATLTGDDGVYRFIVDTAGVSAVGGATGLGNAWESWTRDTTAPVATDSELESDDPTADQLVEFEVEFSEFVTGVDISDFTLTTTGTLAGASIVSIESDGDSYLVVVNTGTGSGTLRLDVNATGTGITDIANLPLNGGFTAGEVYTVDRVAPAVTSVTRNSPNPTTAATVTYTVTFSEAVTGVDAADFLLTATGGLTGASVTSVSGDGTTYTVTVNTGSGSGTLRLDLPAGDTGIADAAGNAVAGGFSGGEVYSFNRPAPAPQPTPTPIPPVGDTSPPPVTSPVTTLPTSFPVSAPASTPGGTQIKVFDPTTGQNTRALVPFAGYGGTVDVTLMDITGDGVADAIVGAGFGGGPRVAVFDGQTGTMIASFFAFGNGFTGGLDVASADVTGDGVADIIVAAGAGGGPHVKVFDGTTYAEVRSFFAYDASFLGGVRVAAGDVDGDGKADIVTATGPGGGPQVKVFSGADLAVLYDFFAYAPQFQGGVSVAVGDVNGDGFADIITGAGAGGPHVRVFDGKNGAERGSFQAFRQDFAGGVSVAVTDADADGKADIAVGAGPGGGPHVMIFDGETFGQLSSTYAFDEVLGGGVFVG